MIYKTHNGVFIEEQESDFPKTKYVIPCAIGQAI